jgi:hypothetical protein
MGKTHLTRALSLLGIAGVLYVGVFFAFVRAHAESGSLATASKADICSVPSDSHIDSQNQVYFVGCGGFF